MYEEYLSSFWALWVIVFTVIAQSLIATGAHRKQAQYVPGVVDENLGHGSFVFRSHRTFQNSMENAPLMLFTGFLAVMVGLSPGWLAATAWIYLEAEANAPPPQLPAHWTLHREKTAGMVAYRLARRDLSSSS